VPKLLGVALALLGLLQPRRCYKWPLKPFWWFIVYFGVFLLWGGYLLLTPPDIPDFSSTFFGYVRRMIQLFVLLWICCNLLQEYRTAQGALWALSLSAVVLSLLQLLGVTSNVSSGGRVGAFEAANPNNLAAVLSLGFLALAGLSYGQNENQLKYRVFCWIGAAIVGIAIALTGSRGAILAIVGTLFFLLFRGRSLATQLKFAAVALVAMALLAAASYQVEAVRARWERTFYEESLAGRERIFPEAVDMILERPILGWGPIVHLWELGPRLGWPMRDEHNSYLYLLAEGGIVGALPFFAGLWVSLRCAWRGRRGIAGLVPLLMLMFILLLSMKGTLHHRKYYWLVVGYVLAASTYKVRPRYLNVTVLTNHQRASEGRRQERLARSRFQRSLRP
jgi:O-antigen ligase